MKSPNKNSNKPLAGFRAYMALADRFCLNEDQKQTLVNMLNDPTSNGTSSDIVSVAAHVHKIRAFYGVNEEVFHKAFEQELEKIENKIKIESN